MAALFHTSTSLDDLAIGNSISVKGPKGNFVYQPNMCKEIGMIAGKYARVFISYVGGTGITPMLQVIKAILKNPRDVTKVSLVFANVTEEDILCREELDSLAKDPRFNVYYVLNNVCEIINSNLSSNLPVAILLVELDSCPRL